MASSHLGETTKRYFTIRLALDQLLLKEGLRALIEDEEGLFCVDEKLGKDADVTVVDLSDSGAVEKIYGQGSHSEAKLVVLTDALHSTALEDLCRSSIRAVVAKTADGPSLLNAFRIVASGGKWFDPQVAAKNGTKSPSRIEQRARWESLTSRERQVAKLILQGAPTNLIGGWLGLSQHTVRNYRRSIFRKLHIHSRLELVLYWSSQYGPSAIDLDRLRAGGDS